MHLIFSLILSLIFVASSEATNFVVNDNMAHETNTQIIDYVNSSGQPVAILNDYLTIIVYSDQGVKTYQLQGNDQVYSIASSLYFNSSGAVISDAFDWQSPSAIQPDQIATFLNSQSQPVSNSKYPDISISDELFYIIGGAILIVLAGIWAFKRVQRVVAT